MAVLAGAVALLAAGVWVAALTSPAAGGTAAVGQLAWEGCLANTAAGGCGDLPGDPLTHPRAIAVSPDGTSVYVAAGTNTILGFSATSPGGKLVFTGCLNNDGSQGCFDIPGAPLTVASDLAVSPDGKWIYTVGGDVVARFATGPAGNLYWVDCLNNDGSEGCGKLPHPLFGLRSLAEAPNGRAVYAVASIVDTVVRFAVKGDFGTLVWAECFNNAGDAGCTDLPAAPLGALFDVAVSPDSRSVYAISGIGTNVMHFFAQAGKDGHGELTWDGCLDNSGVQNCAAIPGAPLARLFGVTAGARGVYVTGGTAIHHFSTASQGQLSWEGCLENSGFGGCGPLPAEPLGDASGVAVASDDGSVYAASVVPGSVSHVNADASGHLSWNGCFDNDGSQDCVDVPGTPLGSAIDVAVNRAGTSVYVIAYDGNSISHFTREPAPPPPTTSPPSSSSTSTTTPPPTSTSASTASTTTTTGATTTTAAADTSAPTAPRLLRGRYARGTLTLRWRAATDNIGIAAYEVRRDGRLARRVGRAAAAAAFRNFHPRKRTVFTVVARDAAANVGHASNRLAVTRKARPRGLPRVIPAWAHTVIAWELKGKHGRRPSTPRPVPAWYGRWHAWQLQPYRIA